MGIKNTSKEYSEDYIPSTGDDTYSNIIPEEINRSEDIAKVLIDFETEVVPQMLKMGLMKEIAKSRSKPFYNDSDQTMTAHILPGIEVMADIVEQSDTLDKSEFRKLIALWTIHDVHKLINNPEEDYDRNEEFNINEDTVQSWIENLNLDTFSNNQLTLKDFHSCVVGLHNGDNSNIDSSTNTFTKLRPHLRLVDAIMSINSADNYLNEAEKVVDSVFGKPGIEFIPATHSVDIEDSIIRKLLNKSIIEELKNKGLKPIDLREDSVFYARPTDVEYGSMDNFLDSIIDNFISNLRDSYSIFRNQAFKGGDISSGDAQRGNWYMPKVYDITNLSKLCLNNTEIIQRIVQASVDQQNRPWDMSDEAIEQIEELNTKLDVDIPKNSFIDGMAALVHTVYREIIPELVDENSEHAHERTMESAIIHIFGVSEDVQEIIADSLKNNTVNTSITSWSYKYLIAHDLHKRYTRSLSITERQNELIKLISTRLSDFENWNKYGEEDTSKIKRELYLLFASNIKIDGMSLKYYDSTRLLDYMSKTGDINNCAISSDKTEQNASSPDLLSHRNIDVLEVPFVTEQNNKFENIDLTDIIKKKPLSVLSQISLNVRAQQFIKYNEVSNKNELYITSHPVESISVASSVRFNRVLQYVKNEMFTGDNSSIGLNNIADNYESIISDSLSQPSGVNAILNRNKVYNIGSTRDASCGKFTLPDDKESTIVKGAICATIASIMSGVRVFITRKPQLYTNPTNKKDLVIYGPELSMFDNIMDSHTDVTTLPQQLEIMERLIKMNDKTGTSGITIENYNQIQNTDDIEFAPGSMIYNNVHHLFDTPEKSMSASKDAVNIDSLAAQNNDDAKNLLQYNTRVGRKLNNLLPENNTMLANAVMTHVYNKLIEMESINTTDEQTNTMMKHLANISELNLTAEDMADDGSAKVFAEEILDVYVEIENETGMDFQSIKKQFISGIVVRSVMNTTN